MSTAPVAARPHLLPWFIASVVGVGALAYFSIVTGVADLDLSDPGQVWELLRISRGPRTAALILAGSSLAVAGMIMQMLTRNRFVEPSTAGTTDFATLGLLLITLFAPATPQIGKMVAGAVMALLGTALFLLLLKSLRVRGVLVVPLMGLMLGGIVSSIVTFIAYQEQLSQSLSAWTSADLSGVIEGRYELLWLMLVVLAVTVIMADRFTVAGLGEDFTTNLGMDPRRVMFVGLSVVAVTTSIVVVTVGSIPFLGLIVPNLVSLFIGDHLRRAIPWVAVLGAGLLLACDTAGRIINFPYEIPLGVMMGVIGSLLFLVLLLKRSRRVG
ncbi:ABC transporter permease [Dermabacteraceae bacterium P13138]